MQDIFENKLIQEVTKGILGKHNMLTAVIFKCLHSNLCNKLTVVKLNKIRQLVVC
jgi:hypothetical protein